MIQIDEILLRVPGLKPGEAAELGAAVGQKLAEKGNKQLPEGLSANASINDVKISLRSAVRTKEELAAAIAEQVLAQITIATL